MKKSIIYLTIFIINAVILINASAIEAKNWRTTFIEELKKGKEIKLPESSINEDGEEGEEGLAYTPAQEIVLEEAITVAIKENSAPACECMKLAIEFEYDAYLVLKNIYAAGGEVLLDQLCMCATEAGLIQAVIARAAADAKSKDPETLDEPIFSPDEIIQSQCLGGEEGLAYTAPDAPPLKAIPINPTNNPNYPTPVGATN